MSEGQDYLDGRAAAKQVRLQPAKLLALLLDDGVPVIQVSPRVWRVGAEDFRRWIEQRQAQAAEQHRQRRMRRQYVAEAGSAAGNHPIPSFLR